MLFIKQGWSSRKYQSAIWTSAHIGYFSWNLRLNILEKSTSNLILELRWNYSYMLISPPPLPPSRPVTGPCPMLYWCRIPLSWPASRTLWMRMTYVNRFQTSSRIASLRYCLLVQEYSQACDISLWIYLYLVVQNVMIHLYRLVTRCY